MLSSFQYHFLPLILMHTQVNSYLFPKRLLLDLTSMQLILFSNFRRNMLKSTSTHYHLLHHQPYFFTAIFNKSKLLYRRSFHLFPQSKIKLQSSPLTDHIRLSNHKINHHSVKIFPITYLSI